MPIRWDNISAPSFSPGHLMGVAQGAFEAGTRGAYTGALQLQETLKAAQDQINNKASMELLQSGAETSPELLEKLRSMRLNPNVDVGALTADLQPFAATLDTADTAKRTRRSSDNVALLDKAFMDMRANMAPEAFNDQLQYMPIMKLASSLEASDPNKYGGITSDYAKSMEGQRMTAAETLQASLVEEDRLQQEKLAERLQTEQGNFIKFENYDNIYFDPETRDVAFNTGDKTLPGRISSNESAFRAVADAKLGKKAFDVEQADLSDYEKSELGRIGIKFKDPALFRLMVDSAVDTNSDGSFKGFNVGALKELETLLHGDLLRRYKGDSNNASNLILAELMHGNSAESIVNGLKAGQSAGGTPDLTNFVAQNPEQAALQQKALQAQIYAGPGGYQELMLDTLMKGAKGAFKPTAHGQWFLDNLNYSLGLGGNTSPFHPIAAAKTGVVEGIKNWKSGQQKEAERLREELKKSQGQ